jgi:hypothetical protein
MEYVVSILAMPYDACPLWLISMHSHPPDSEGILRLSVKEIFYEALAECL